MASVDEVWGQLVPALGQLVAAADKEDDSLRLPKETTAKLYALVYNTSTLQGQHASDQLYKRVGQFIDTCCRERFAPHLRDQLPDRLMTEVSTRWTKFKSVRKGINSIFSYLDRYYAKARHLRTVEEVAVNSFRLFVVDPVAEEISTAIIQLLREARTTGTVANADQMKRVVDVFVDLGCGKLFYYQQSIEQPYLTDVRAYIRAHRYQEAAQQNEQHRLIIEREQELARQVLHPTTQPKLASLAPK